MLTHAIRLTENLAKHRRAIRRAQESIDSLLPRIGTALVKAEAEAAGTGWFTHWTRCDCATEAAYNAARAAASRATWYPADSTPTPGA